MCVASITTLAVISVERYMLIAYPGRFTVTNRITLIAIIAVWAYAFIATFPPVVGWSSFQLESPGVACAPYWESRAPLDFSYEIYLLFLAFIFPVLTILTCYGKLLNFLRNRIQHGAGHKVAKGQSRLTWMVVLMVVAFLVAWLPYAVVCMMIMAGGQHLVSATAASVAPIFCKSSLIYNPIIYVLFNTQMRSAFVSLITCGRIVPPTSGGGKVHPTFGPKDMQTGAAIANRSSETADHSSTVKKNALFVAAEEASVPATHPVPYSSGIKKISKP
ncbi:hypothetical protein RvY_07308-1 [Ramazzottius varieornatus]|uniref:G-protein coupled receptors family 1 profile domain-containing protein n=1 Tax=Ramazzottius varieornatus TaxID=947166 RepID=A0A1D1VB45_RAMVA|nr:hypothetical protein RvY_07308-1 [Ramazzottius varieornatus]